jgi:hypothetical protein
MKRLVLLACVLAGVSQGCRSQVSAPPALTVHAEVLRQAYCPIDGEFFSVRLSLKLRFTNHSAENMILARRMEDPLIIRGAKDAEAFARGEFEFDPAFDVYRPPRSGKRRFGKAPDDNKFVILGPGKSYDTLAQDSFAASRQPAPGFLASGNHVIQVGIATWPLKYQQADPTVTQGQWARFGRLQSETLFSDLLPLVIPAGVAGSGCAK